MTFNWWLMALSFVLGLVITLAFVVRRVRREVPVDGAGRATSAKLVGSAGVGGAHESTRDTGGHAAGTSAPAATFAATGASSAATPATTEVAAAEDVPAGRFGVGSATPGEGGVGPEGWAVKGNEDSMLYHTPQSPSYRRTVAEVWFRDVETAEKAGFHRWDSGKSQRRRT